MVAQNIMARTVKFVKLLVIYILTLVGGLFFSFEHLFFVINISFAFYQVARDKVWMITFVCVLFCSHCVARISTMAAILWRLTSPSFRCSMWNTTMRRVVISQTQVCPQGRGQVSSPIWMVPWEVPSGLGQPLLQVSTLYQCHSTLLKWAMFVCKICAMGQEITVSF